MAEKMWGYSPCGIFGYSHMLGGYAGGQAEYARVPFADIGPLKVPEELTDEQVLFLSDIFPTGYMAAEACNIQPGEIVAVWGCGPVGQFAIASAYLLGAERVIAIDRFPYRLEMARDRAGAAETINYEEVDVREALDAMTGGRGPDSCIDAVGMEGSRARDGRRLRSRQDDADDGDGSPGRPPAGHPAHAEAEARFPSQASTADSSTNFRWVPSSTDRSPSNRARRTCTATCGLYWSECATDKSTPASSSRTVCGWTTPQPPTACSMRRKTTA